MKLYKTHIIAILLLVLLFSGCTSIKETVEKTPVLYITVNITENESKPQIQDVVFEMEEVSPLKVPASDQNAQPPFVATLAYANMDIVSYKTANPYTGNGTYTITMPMIKEKLPKYNDTITFEMRYFNETDDFGRTYFVAKWRWNNSEI